MFRKLFGGSREDKNEYVDRTEEINRIVQSDLSEEDKKRIIMNLNEDIEDDYK